MRHAVLLVYPKGVVVEGKVVESVFEKDGIVRRDSVELK